MRHFLTRATLFTFCLLFSHLISSTNLLILGLEFLASSEHIASVQTTEEMPLFAELSSSLEQEEEQKEHERKLPVLILSEHRDAAASKLGSGLGFSKELFVDVHENATPVFLLNRNMRI